MLYWLLYSLHEYYFPFNVFRYITFRTALAVITASLLTFTLAPYLINKLKRLKLQQKVREDGPKTHLSKEGTPTMGGILIIISIVLTAFLWMDLKNPYLWIMIIATLGYGTIGCIDDYLKIKSNSTKGLKACYKFIFQIVLTIGISIFLYYNPLDPYSTKLSVPFFKKWLIDLGIFYMLKPIQAP